MISSVYSSFTKLASPNRGLNPMFGICRCFPIPETFLSSVTQSIAFISDRCIPIGFPFPQLQFLKLLTTKDWEHWQSWSVLQCGKKEHIILEVIPPEGLGNVFDFTVMNPWFNVREKVWDSFKTGSPEVHVLPVLQSFDTLVNEV